MNWIDVLGYAASVMVLATFCVSTMLLLRLLAIGSNMLFIGFGARAHIYPVLLLHLILLPVNVVRLMQLQQRVHSHLIVARLLSNISSRRIKAGLMLMPKGKRSRLDVLFGK
jgi:CRP/FNR family transcriptional regulator, cyclic AMP receptor protein